MVVLVALLVVVQLQYLLEVLVALEEVTLVKLTWMNSTNGLMTKVRVALVDLEKILIIALMQ